MRKIWVHRAKSFADAERFDAWFWRRAGAAARFEAAWSMVSDFLKMRGKSRAQLRNHYRTIVDSWMLFDNSGSVPHLIAEHQLGETRIVDENLYSRILQLGGKP